MRIHDRNVNIARLTGTNRVYLETQIPHITRLMADSAAEVIEFGDVVVIGNAAPAFRDALQPVLGRKKIVDLVRLFEPVPAVDDYVGLTW